MPQFSGVFRWIWWPIYIHCWERKNQKKCRLVVSSTLTWHALKATPVAYSDIALKANLTVPCNRDQGDHSLLIMGFLGSSLPSRALRMPINLAPEKWKRKKKQWQRSDEVSSRNWPGKNGAYSCASLVKKIQFKVQFLHKKSQDFKKAPSNWLPRGRTNL